MRSTMCAGVWAAGLVAAAGSAARADGPGDGGVEFLPARIEGHVYINARTGEVMVTPVGGARHGDLFWENDDIAGSCNFFTGVDRPTRDTTLGRVKFGASVVTWGDVVAQSGVTGFEIAYATNIGGDDCSDPVDHVFARIDFIERYDSLVNPGGPVTDPGGAGPAFLTASFVVELPVEPQCGTVFFMGQIITIDLEGSGEEFVLGDVASGLGADVDGDGLADFGYGYTFIQDQGPDVAKGIIGPFLVKPASLGGAGTATGVPDRYSWFNNLSGTAGTVEYTDYAGDFFFGGGSCPTTPYAVMYMNLYGTEGSTGSRCEAIDYTADGIIDFPDYLEFLNRFDAGDPSADLNGDGVVEFLDWLEFYNRYYDCQG